MRYLNQPIFHSKNLHRTDFNRWSMRSHIFPTIPEESTKLNKKFKSKLRLNNDLN